MGKKQPEIIDVETVEVKDVEEEKAPRCEVRVGMDENSQLYFRILGSDQNLVLVDGLLDYAKQEMNGIWANKLNRK